MRRHLTYANVAATLALVFAMSGGALAAKHYLLTSTKQIKPSVLKQLRKAGPRGPTGATGPAGAAGPVGPSGATTGTPAEPGATSAIIDDAPTGAKVFFSQTGHAFEVVNGNPSDDITVAGVVQAQGPVALGWEATIAPGKSALSPNNAVLTEFIDIVITRDGANAAGSPMVHVTCGMGFGAGSETRNCTAVH